MRHLNLGRKLNRTSAHRKALFKNMFLALVKSSRITTTDAKAKELRRFADRMVTLGKKNDLAARRRAFSYLQSHQAVKKLFDEIAPRYKDRAGGYTPGGEVRLFAVATPPNFRSSSLPASRKKRLRKSVLGAARKRARMSTLAIATPPPAPESATYKGIKRPAHPRSAFFVRSSILLAFPLPMRRCLALSDDFVLWASVKCPICRLQLRRSPMRRAFCCAWSATFRRESG